jgi:hypothetical protein
MNIQLFTLIILGSLLPVVCAGAENQSMDRIETIDGAVLTGDIKEESVGYITLTTSYAGTLVVDRSQIVRISNLEDHGKSSGKAVAVSPAPTPAPVAPAAAPEKMPDIWSFELGFNLNGNQGNTEKLDLALTADIEMDRKKDRLDIYSRYSYGKNRGKSTANEVILGSQYTNFFNNNIGFFFREELEHDDFEGVLYRSTTASGFSWKLRSEESLTIETRSGLSYRYEDFKDDGYEDYPGMDFGLNINWQFIEWARFKGSYTYLPSVADFGDYILRQDTGFNLPLDYSNLWQLRLGVVSKYNNQPDVGREKLDHRYYARLIASWN